MVLELAPNVIQLQHSIALLNKLGALNKIHSFFSFLDSQNSISTEHTTYAAALKTTTHPKTRCRKPYAAT